MGGMQLYSVVVTRDAEKKEILSPAHFNQSMVKEAPVVLTFCADFRRFCKYCQERNAVPGYGNLMSFLNAAMDTLLVAQTFCTLAEEAGLGIDGSADSYGANIKIDEEQVQLMKRRGGVGHDLSHIRPKGSPVKNSALTSTGLVPFMERYSNSTMQCVLDFFINK